MISGGNVTVYISDMDAAVRFYTDVLGLTLDARYGDHWATVKVGDSLTIGLHPRSEHYPEPGTKGAMMLGLEIKQPIADVVADLKAKGVIFTGEIVDDMQGKFAHFTDPDGNPIYLWQTTWG